MCVSVRGRVSDVSSCYFSLTVNFFRIQLRVLVVVKRSPQKPPTWIRNVSVQEVFRVIRGYSLLVFYNQNGSDPQKPISFLYFFESTVQKSYVFIFIFDTYAEKSVSNPG